MSHDVDVSLSECDVSLSFTAPGRLVYLFFYEKGTLDCGCPESVKDCGHPEARELGKVPTFTREDWDRLTAIVHENLP